MTRVRILHCHSTFSLGGKEARAARLMNAFGDWAEHTILSAVPDALSAREAIDPGIRVAFPGDAAPALHGKPGFRRYRKIARYMRDFDLVLTYNWGAMDAVAARRLFGSRCPPLVHHEDGFNADEAVRLNLKRNLFRQFALDAAAQLVVPSRHLASIARLYWRWPDAVRIPNGVDTQRYAAPPEPGSIPGLVRRDGDLVVGTLAGLRAVKNLPRLVRAVAALPAHARLVIIGEGPERETIRSEAARLGMADRLLMPGFLPDPHRYVGHFDIFALSSDSEQFPISLVEAMAAGRPVVATDVGDVATIVAPENLPYIVDVADEAALTRALATLDDSDGLRRSLGAANQALAVREYDEQRMIAAYAALYEAAMQKPDALLPRG